MKKSLIILPSAEVDIAEIYAWYEEQRLGLGNEFIFELENYFDRISANPFLFPVKHEDYRTCFLKRFPYCVYYLPIDKDVWVWAVLHTSRDMEKVLGNRKNLND